MDLHSMPKGDEACQPRAPQSNEQSGCTAPITYGLILPEHIRKEREHEQLTYHVDCQACGKTKKLKGISRVDLAPAQAHQAGYRLISERVLCRKCVKSAEQCGERAGPPADTGAVSDARVESATETTSTDGEQNDNSPAEVGPLPGTPRIDGPRELECERLAEMSETIQSSDPASDSILLAASASPTGDAQALPAPVDQQLRPAKARASVPAQVAAPRRPSHFELDVAEERIVFGMTPHADGRVHIECSRDGQVEGGFTLDVMSTAAERTLSLELSRLGAGQAAPGARELAANRILAEARRVALIKHVPTTALDPELRAEEFLNTSDLSRRLQSDLIAIGFRVDPQVGMVLYLCKITALLDAPVYVYLVGPPASLKTTYADLTASITAPEMLKHLTDLTPKALYYGATDLSHYVIALDELDLKGRGLAMDQKVLRMLFSKNWCEIETTQGGRTRRRRVQGPVMVIQTTTATEFDEQDESRRLVIELADTPERTDVVLGLMGEQYAGLTDKNANQHLIEMHRSVHRLLPCKADILVPFAPTLAGFMPHDRIVVVRTFRTLISLIKASALLHHRHRRTDGDGHIVATIDDYRVVHKYAGELVARSMGPTSGGTAALAWVQLVLRKHAVRALARANAGEHRERALLQRLGESEFERTGRRWVDWMPLDELVDLSGRPRATVQRYLAQLQKTGLVDTQKKGRAFQYRLATPGGELPKCPTLPTPDQVEREHLGTSPKPFEQPHIECPPQDGPPIQENSHGI